MWVARASAAKKAEAFFRISLARWDSASSLRSLRFSASRSTDSVGADMPDSLCLRTQIRRVSREMLSSSAMRETAPRAVSGSPCVCRTSSMALAFSSGVYFEGMGLLLCNPVPSIKPGAIHPSAYRSVPHPDIGKTVTVRRAWL